MAHTILNLKQPTQMTDGNQTLYFPKGQFIVKNKVLHPVHTEYKNAVKYSHIYPVETPIVEEIPVENIIPTPINKSKKEGV